MEILQSYYIIIPLVILQSIAGVGILVVGTPLLLLLNYSIIQIMSFLLPISLLTSLFNIFFIKLVNKKKTKFQLDVDIKKIFFLYCLPGVFLGIMIIKYFQNYRKANYQKSKCKCGHFQGIAEKSLRRFRVM